jgi:hypothetical protein
MFRQVCGFTSLRECSLIKSNEWPQSGNVPEADNGPNPDSQADQDPDEVKPLLARGNSVQLVGEDEERETVVADTEQMTLDGDAREITVDAHAMWTKLQTYLVRYGVLLPLSDFERCLASFLIRGWASPGGSVMSAPTASYPQGPQGLLWRHWVRKSTSEQLLSDGRSFCERKNQLRFYNSSSKRNTSITHI